MRLASVTSSAAPGHLLGALAPANLSVRRGVLALDRRCFRIDRRCGSGSERLRRGRSGGEGFGGCRSWRLFRGGGAPRRFPPSPIPPAPPNVGVRGPPPWQTLHV